MNPTETQAENETVKLVYNQDQIPDSELESNKLESLHHSPRHACKVEYYSSENDEQNAQVIKRCALELKNGNLVSFPTETVYGLGALVTIPDAVKHIFTCKRRPLTDPIISHFYEVEDAYRMIDEEELKHIQPVFDFLGERFWPGPLTLVCLASKNVTPLLTANSGYIGIRIPIHPVARALLKEVQPVGIGAPSANRFGHVSPTKASHVIDDLGDETRLTVIDVDQNNEDFSCGIGIESTVAKLQYTSDDTVVITVLRRGGVSVEEIQRVLSEKSFSSPKTVLMIENHKIKNDTKEGVAAPGQMITHYAPDVPAYLLKGFTEENCNSMTVIAGLIPEAVIIDFAQSVSHLKSQCLKYIDLSSDGSVEEARKNIFQILRDAEKITDAKVIVLPDLNAYTGTKEHADACHDRLFRAASGQGCIIRNGQILVSDSN